MSGSQGCADRVESDAQAAVVPRGLNRAVHLELKSCRFMAQQHVQSGQGRAGHGAVPPCGFD